MKKKNTTIAPPKVSLKQKIAAIDKYFDARMESLERAFDMRRDKIFEDYRNTLQDVERNVALYKAKYYDLSKCLTALLTPEQIEAAKIAGTDPEHYAIEWMSICIERAKAEKYIVKMENLSGPTS